MAPTGPAPAATASPADRTYLLERVDEAAVVQVVRRRVPHLPLQRARRSSGTCIRPPSPAATSIYDQRYAHNLEMRDVLEESITHAAARRRGDARRDPALHQAVLDQHRARTTTSRRASSCCAARRRRLPPRRTPPETPAQRSRCDTARRSISCSRASSRCSSIRVVRARP